MEVEYARTESNVETRSTDCRIDGQTIKTHYPRFGFSYLFFLIN